MYAVGKTQKVCPQQYMAQQCILYGKNCITSNTPFFLLKDTKSSNQHSCKAYHTVLAPKTVANALHLMQSRCKPAVLAVAL
jgi:hypothetical protein